MTTTDPITEYLSAIESATIPECQALAPDVTFDATVPEWRYRVHGADAVRQELAKWYATAGAFEDLTRTATPTGEFIQFVLHWEENGMPFAVHQAHVVDVEGGRIVRDTTWCGGRWSATLMAEMAAAQL
jgi:ketosteroid isomerase-like protein